MKYTRCISKYQSLGWCGHLILPGEVIGYNKQEKHIICNLCFYKYLEKVQQKIRERYGQ